MKVIHTENFEQTQLAGQNLAKEILVSKPQQSATILALQGDLGAGKTTFLQGFAKGLGVDEIVNSPTFVIMKRFKTNGLRFKNFYHFDLYRLEDEKDVKNLGFAEIINNPQNVVAIEWPGKITDILPTNIISIQFDHLDEHKRNITIK